MIADVYLRYPRNAIVHIEYGDGTSFTGVIKKSSPLRIRVGDQHINFDHKLPHGEAGFSFVYLYIDEPQDTGSMVLARVVGVHSEPFIKTIRGGWATLRPRDNIVVPWRALECPEPFDQDDWAERMTQEAAMFNANDYPDDRLAQIRRAEIARMQSERAQHVQDGHAQGEIETTSERTEEPEEPESEPI